MDERHQSGGMKWIELAVAAGGEMSSWKRGSKVRPSP